MNSDDFIPDPNDEFFDRILRQTPEYRSGVLRLGVDKHLNKTFLSPAEQISNLINAGKIVSRKMGYQVSGENELYTDPRKAIERIRSLDFRDVATFEAGASRTQRSLLGNTTNGNYFYSFFEALADALPGGHQVVRESYGIPNVEAAGALNARYRKGGKDFGLFSTHKNRTTVLRILDSEGRDKSRNEIIKLLENEFGLKLQSNAALDKRLSAILASRAMTSFEKNPEKLYTVALFDPTKEYGHIFKDFAPEVKDEFAKAVSDGMIIINPNTVRGLAQSIEKEAKARLKGIPQGQEGTAAAMRIRRDADAMFKQAAKFKEMAETGRGRLGEVRMAGFDITELINNSGIAFTPAEEEALRAIQGMAKGDAIMGPKNMTTDFIIPKTAIVPELSIEGGKSRFLSFAEHPHSDRVLLDVQTLLANPDLFRVEDLQKATTRELDSFFTALTGTTDEKKLKKAKEALQYIANQEIPKEKDAAEKVLKQVAYANKALEELKLHGRILDPYIAKQLGHDWGAFLVREDTHRKGIMVPRQIVPDASRAGILNVEATKFQGRKLELAEGSMAYDDMTESWVVGARDAMRMRLAHGGFDYDDTIVTMLRYDEENKQLFGINYRNPTDFGEVSALRISEDNLGVERALRYKGLETEADTVARLRSVNSSIATAEKEATAKGSVPEALARHIERYKAERTSLQAEVHGILSRHITGISKESLDRVVGRSIMYKNPFEDLARILRTPEDLNYPLQQHKNLVSDEEVQALEQEIRAAQKSGKENVLDILSGEAAKAERGKVINVARTRFGYPVASNIKMLFSELINNPELQEHLGDTKLLSKFTQELLVDTAGVVNLDKINEKMMREYGEAVAMLTHKTGAPVIDSALWAAKGPRSTNLLEAFQKGLDITNDRLGLKGKERYHHTGHPELGRAVIQSKDDPRGIYARIKAVTEGTHTAWKERVDRYANRELNFGPAINDVLLTAEEQRDARMLHSLLKQSAKDAEAQIKINEPEIARIFKELGLESGPAARRLANQSINTRFLETIHGFAEDNGEIGAKAMRRWMGVMQLTADEGRGGHLLHIDEGDAFSPSILTNMTKRYALESAGQLPEEVAREPVQRVTRREIESQLGYKPTDVPGSKRKQQMADAYEAASGVASDVYRKINMTEIKDFIKKPLVKTAGIATLGLLGFSYLYRRHKRDISPEEMHGPMLPGGGAYEQSAVQQFPLPDPRSIGLSSGGGMTYHVSVDGDNYNPADLHSKIADITGGQISGGYYNSQSSKRIKRPKTRSYMKSATTGVPILSDLMGSF